MFASANSIRTNSPVRIAGVNVGKVTSVDPAGGKASTTSVVTMEVQGSRKDFDNLRMFIRMDGGPWKLLAWANEPI